MYRKAFLSLSVASILGLAGLAAAGDMAGMDMGKKEATSQPATTQPTTDKSAKDLANTVCPVTGEKVGDSKLTETYDGKTYHLCCSDCPATFKKDAAKYSKAVADDPKKYGVKD